MRTVPVRVSYRLLLGFQPIDDFATGRFPDPLVSGDVAKYLIKVPDAPRLAHDPGMQMKHHQASRGRAAGVEPIKPVPPQQVDFVDGAPAVQMDIVVVEIGVYA